MRRAGLLDQNSGQVGEHCHILVTSEQLVKYYGNPSCYKVWYLAPDVYIITVVVAAVIITIIEKKSKVGQ